METEGKIKAIWNILRGRKTLFRAAPRVVVAPGDQEMFAAIMNKRLKLEDTSMYLKVGRYTLDDGTYNVTNPIYMGNGAYIVGLGIHPIKAGNYTINQLKT